MSSAPLLSVEDLTLGTRHSGGRTVPIVEGVSFQVRAGQRLGIVGESGSGKSLTLRAVAGLLPRGVEVLSGRIRYEGEDVLTMPARERQALMGPEIAMVFQEPMTALNPVMRVGDQIAEGPRRHLGLSAKQARELAVQMMARTGIPDPARRARAYPHELSGGLRQRVMIAMAVSCGPRLLLCDEPTTALDVTVQLQVLRLLERLCADNGTSLVFVTHDLAVVNQTCSELAVMYAGHIVEEGGVAEVLPPPPAPLHPRAAGLRAGLRPARPRAGADSRLPAQRRRPPGRLPVRSAVRLRPRSLSRIGPAAGVRGLRTPRGLLRVRPPRRGGARVSATSTSGDATDAQELAPALRVRGVRKTYTGGSSWVSRLSGRQPTSLTALDGVDLELRRGEILALVGESGSGKSTLAKILVGSTSATSGEVHHDERAGARRTTSSSRRVQMVFQDPYSSLNPRLSVGSVLGELLRLHRVVPRAEVRQESIRLLNLVGLEEDALDAYPGQFSGGQRQRIAIARALACRPDVLIADEPVSALDVSVQATILDLFATLREELGLSILFIAHNLAVVQHLSDRVAVMYLGRIVEVADTAELFANPRHPYTRALIDSIPRMSQGSTNDAFELDGEPPSPYDVPAGCRFHPRCALATDVCRTTDPALAPVSPAHVSACLKAGELALIPLPEKTKPEEHA